MTDLTFKALGLAEPILRALKSRDYETPTPIQAQAIPPLMEGRDMIGVAREVMEGAAAPAVALDVPLVVDAGQGDNWAEYSSRATCGSSRRC